MPKIYAEFESFDMADIACRNVKSKTNGVQRISIRDKRPPVTETIQNVIPFYINGTSMATPFVSVLSDTHIVDRSAALVEIICDNDSSAIIKKSIISHGGINVRFYS